MNHQTTRIVLAALISAAVACGGGDDGVLVRVGPDSRSAPFVASVPFQVAARADGYCAVVVLAEPSGDRVTANWSERGFVLSVEEAGRYSIATSDCISVEARIVP